VPCLNAGRAALGGQPAAAMPRTPDAGRAPVLDAASEPVPDAQLPAAAGAGPLVAPEASVCRKVSMSFFACASGQETPGAPRLVAHRAYTLRLRGDYKVDTTFQLQGATLACTAVSFGTLTLPAGSEATARCLTPDEDVALLLTVMSGDPVVWSEGGLQAELCEGCDERP